MESPLNPPWPSPNEDTHRVLRELAESGDWGRYHGPHCERLSSLLKSMHNVDHVHLCSSGTAAIELALRSIPVQSGEEVILAAYDDADRLVARGDGLIVVPAAMAAQRLRLRVVAMPGASVDLARTWLPQGT